MKSKVFLIRNVRPDFYGGGETYQLKLAEMLKRAGFEPYIVTSSKGLLAEAKKQGFRIIEAPYFMKQNYSGWRNILMPIYFVKITWLKRWYRKIFRMYRPAVINVQSRDDWIAVTNAAKKMGIRVLWTDHMDFRSWVLMNIKVCYKNWIGKWVLKAARKADAIIMISDYERRWFEKNVGKYENVVTIKNGVADEYEKYKHIRPREKSFCYVGRVVDYKGIDELVKAFGAVKKRFSDAVLNIYGDGEIKKYQREAGVGVKFYGHTNEPLKAVKENEVFVLPSYREGLSLSLLDAAMMKKKIIASDVDGNPEIVTNDKTGLLVPARNVAKLADAMIWMLENTERAEKMAIAARKEFGEKFDFEKIFAEKMLPLYNIGKE